MRIHRAVRFLTFGLLLLVIPAVLSTPSSAQIGVGISVRIGPPALPIYAQPICPGPGYLWTPGYWAWNDDGGYYWVPGTWVVAPIGMLWTPGYWGWGGGFYAWHAGYWGPHIGFYGGINYGFGYGGVGFVGGEWRGGAFFYNTAVMHVDTVHVTNVYVNRTVVVNNESHVAFNGGEGGVAARPTAAEESAAREPHQAALSAQTQHEHAASQNRAMFASANHGAPAVAATARPGEFSGHGVVAAKAGAEYHAPAISPKEARAPASAANRPASAGSNAANRPSTPPPSGNNASNRTGTENTSHAESAPRTESARPQNQSHQQSAPKAKPAPAKHQSAPREEKHGGKGR
ncbi:MAG: YXWGXW repeat-containing protein [Candidatus Sulfotelmatobacter sp.]